MSFKKIYAIIACDPAGVMGKEGKLPWHCPEDLEHFSNITRNHVIVMGYLTFLSLPKSYFDQRIGIVFSRREHPTNENHNLIFINSLDSFMSLKHLPNEKDCYVIGGAQICRLFLEKNLIDELILTQFKKRYDGDVFFPLSFIHTWPCQKVQESDAFTIHRYLKL